MKITVNEVVSKEVEVTLPAYRKSSCHLYKVISETEVVQITTLGGHETIEVNPFTQNALREDLEIATEKEFYDAFSEVFKVINDKI